VKKYQFIRFKCKCLALEDVKVQYYKYDSAGDLMDRIILHSDLNSFYANVECFSNPKIRHYPVVVVGNLRHGLVLAKNEHAKQCGIVTGETLWQAKLKCPNLISVEPDFDRYLKFSRLTRQIYERYTDQVESFGIDECWLDVSRSTRLFGSGLTIANDIRETIKREMGITASIGVSYNKIFAKLGSDMRKPDAITAITKDNYKDKVWGLPVSDLLYVGASTRKKLHRYGITTIGQLANTDLNFLTSMLGEWGYTLNYFANGKDNSPVKKKGEESFVKSIGNSTTLHRDVETLADIKRVFYMLSESVATRLRQHGLKATTVQIYVRDNTLFSCERQAKLNYPSFLTSEIAEKAMEIYLKKYQYKNPIRSLGIRGCKLVPQDNPTQLDLFTNHHKRERLEVLEQSIDDLRRRFGYNVIQRGILYEDRQLTRINPKDDHTIHPINFFDGTIKSEYDLKI
jgi:DNA polymerase-4